MSGHRLGRPWAWAAVAVALLAPLALGVLALTLSGWRLQVVESGSMAPVYPVGSLLVVEPIDPGRVGVGTPLVFDDIDRGHQVTHRVVAVHDGPNGRFFETRGDANDGSDPALVPARAVVGRARWSVPGLGMPVRWLGHRGAAAVLVGVPMLLLAVTEAAAWRRRHRQSHTHAALAVLRRAALDGDHSGRDPAEVASAVAAVVAAFSATEINEREVLAHA